MSDAEEPPTKMSKYTDLQYLDEDCEDMLDEGQEEWLSDGVLTEDEYNTTADNTQTESNELTTHGTEASPTSKGDATEDKKTEQNIEDTLNTLDSMKNDNYLEEDLDELLIKRTDIKALEIKTKPEIHVNLKQEDSKDDGNDTDDLLRMLGEDNIKIKKKTLKMVKCERNEDTSSDDDDEFIYERSKMTTLKLAKNALIGGKQALKAEPEDMSDDSGQSSDEVSTMKKMFGVPRTHKVASKSSAKTTTEPKRQLIKHVVQVNTNYKKNEAPNHKPMKQYANKTIQPKSILKPATPVNMSKVETKPILKSVEIKTPTLFKPMEKTPKSEKVKSETSLKLEQLEEATDMEILDDNVYDDDEYDKESDEEDSELRIRHPEQMDEEVPSDGDSHTEDGSLYDELPSSDSEDMDDWFALDIRAERAGDYLPLLGSKAHELLVAERGRVQSRVSTLRQSLSALTESARRQAEQLRAAAMALAEIDDTLRAA